MANRHSLKTSNTKLPWFKLHRTYILEFIHTHAHKLTKICTVTDIWTNSRKIAKAITFQDAKHTINYNFKVCRM